MTRVLRTPVRAVARYRFPPPPRLVPTTATAIVACLVVSVGMPEAAQAAHADQAAQAGQAAQAARAPGAEHVWSTQSGPAARAGQDFAVASTSGAAALDRDGFSVSARRSAPATPALDIESGPVVRPVDGSVPTAGGFGARQVTGCRACSTDHHGLDFAAPAGSAVRVTTTGVVVAAGWQGGYGQSVVVQHADGLQTRYAHLSAIDVRVGQRLTSGEGVGAVGSTGVSTGAHLHFEVLVRGALVDPAVWLAERGVP